MEASSRAAGRCSCTGQSTSYSFHSIVSYRTHRSAKCLLDSRGYATDKGFFIPFNSSGVLRYCSHWYLGLLSPIKRINLMCGLLSAEDEARRCCLYRLSELSFCADCRTRPGRYRPNRSSGSCKGRKHKSRPGWYGNPGSFSGRGVLGELIGLGEGQGPLVGGVYSTRLG